jgi:hypothetical protein
MDDSLTGVVLDPYFPGSGMLPTPAGYTGTARLGLSHHLAGSSSFAVRLRFLDRLQVGDDRADVGVLENELGCVVAGD